MLAETAEVPLQALHTFAAADYLPLRRMHGQSWGHHQAHSANAMMLILPRGLGLRQVPAVVSYKPLVLLQTTSITTLSGEHASAAALAGRLAG